MDGGDGGPAARGAGPGAAGRSHQRPVADVAQRPAPHRHHALIRSPLTRPRVPWIRLMGVIRRLRLSFWLAAISTVVLYVFFVGLATISPDQVAALTVVVGALALVFTIRNVRVAAQLADRGGAPQLRRSRNRIRERRGF